MQRFPDWHTLDDTERQQARADALAHARTVGAALNAFVTITPEAGTPGGPLGGLPFAAKDMLRHRGRQPTGGLVTAVDFDLADDSPLIARALAAGGDFIGFTAMTELAYEPSGYNAGHGRVTNPWDLERVSGGSSSGSAAAVAAGLVVAAFGSDTGGSVRIPAHCCGITAWKPTHGLMPEAGAMPLAPSLDSIGVMARSAPDLALLAHAVADFPKSAPIARAALLADVVAECDPAIRHATDDMASALQACAIVVEQCDALPAVEAVDRHALIVMQAESARSHRARLDEPGIDAILRKRLRKGLDIPDATLTESLNARESLRRDWGAAIGNADIAILPVMGILTPTAAECDPTSPSFSPKTLYALSRFTRFVNMLGLPAIALPAGFDGNGMPIAIQLIGRLGADSALIDLAQKIQARTDWHGRVPRAVAPLIEKEKA